jgi:hypothetical protein
LGSFATRGAFVTRTAPCSLLAYLYVDYLIQTSTPRNIDKICGNQHNYNVVGITSNGPVQVKQTHSFYAVHCHPPFCTDLQTIFFVGRLNVTGSFVLKKRDGNEVWKKERIVRRKVRGN